MNFFISKINDREIVTLSQLKSCYRQIVKKVHPDTAGRGSKEFIVLYRQFQEAKAFLEHNACRFAEEGSVPVAGNGSAAASGAGPGSGGQPARTVKAVRGQKPVQYSRRQVQELFVDLMCSNFPIDRRVAGKNALYSKRIVRINAMLNTLLAEQDLFLKFEKDLYILRRDTVASNHEYNVIVMYLNNIRDFILMENDRCRSCLENTYPLTASILLGSSIEGGSLERRRHDGRRLDGALRFINWLVQDNIEGKNLSGEIPAARRGD